MEGSGEGSSVFQVVREPRARGCLDVEPRGMDGGSTEAEVVMGVTTPVEDSEDESNGTE